MERAGWRFGSAEEFLELTEDEQSLVETKLALADAPKAQRENIAYRNGAGTRSIAAVVSSSDLRFINSSLVGYQLIL